VCAPPFASLAEGFRTIAVRECIGDRVPGAVAWNLFDIDAKFADVESVDTCVNYLNNVDGFNQKARLSG
jgi:maleamate amidohydrolase